MSANTNTAHSPTPETLSKRFELYQSENISIARLIQSPENVMPSFTHSHPEYEFLIPHTPIPNLLVEDGPFFGEVGWVYPVQTGRSHGLKHPLTDVSHTNIAFDKDYFEAMMESIGKQGEKFNYEFEISQALLFCLESFQSEYKKGPGCNGVKLNLLRDLICINILEEGLDPEKDTRKDENRYNRGLRTIIHYINTHYASEISIGQLVEMSGFSKYYFIRIFKQATGESPVTYINKLRLSKAKYFFETTDNSITEISKMCGFKTPSSFTSQFKRVTGMTPKEYKLSLDS